MNDGTVLGGDSLGAVPANWHIAGTGDFNGDHKSDILWRNDAGLVAIWDMNDTTFIGGDAGRPRRPTGISPTPATTMATARATFCGATMPASPRSGTSTTPRFSAAIRWARCRRTGTSSPRPDTPVLTGSEPGNSGHPLDRLRLIRRSVAAAPRIASNSRLDRATQGGFNRSSQHSSKGGCDEGIQARFG